MPKVHDIKIWKRIVEAFEHINVPGTPTAIARELRMKQPSVRQWKIGETTPSRRHILAIAKRTGFRSGYLEDAELPKKAPMEAPPADPLFDELLHIWNRLNDGNRGRVVERAAELLARQFPDSDDSSELQRRPS